jgi:dihydroorotase
MKLRGATTLRIRRPDDFHVHLRQGMLLLDVLPATALVFGRALVMPNTWPPVLTGDDAQRYERVIRGAAEQFGATDFHPLMTIKIVASTTPEMITDAKAKGVVAGKLYPVGVTTNADDGVRVSMKATPLGPSLSIGVHPQLFTAMEEAGMVLCLHGEMPGDFCMDRERAFLGVVEALAQDYPRLRIVLEHITTNAAVVMVKRLPNRVAATITPHHLLLTLDDVVGDKLQPHHFCKPIAKAPNDRLALIQAATSGNPKFFLGTDSAPHQREEKECASGCAGVFSAPVAMEVLAEVFEDQNALERLEAFTSEFGARFYGLPLNDSHVSLVKQETPYRVPEYVDFGRDDWALAPLRRGGTLRWLCQV